MDTKLAEIFEGKHPNFSTGKLKDKIIKENIFPYECAICKISKWQNKHIVLQLDHIDGNNKNHLKSNLRLLCPNCHSQTDTFAGKNIKNNRKRYNVSDEEILNALLNSATISSAITSLGLSKGGNYKRFIKIANDNKLYHLLVNINEKILTDEIYEELVKIDYSKFGWVSKAAKIIGISPQKARKWIERKCPELIEQSFSRNK
ncbi:hypothetical protein [Escherichia phage T4_ev151]|nr:HNH endonuclease [Escherichia phage a51]VUF55460.1 hypothetical protein [Escherichia phage T4_ev151]